MTQQRHRTFALLGRLRRIAAAGALALTTGAMAQPADAVRAVEVAPGVWMAQGAAAMGSSANRNFVSNATFVVTAAGVVVVDALGSPTLAEELLAEIRRVTPQPVRYAVVTHYHADHIYGLQVFKAAGARVIAHRDARSYLQSEVAVQRLKLSREELWPWIDESTRLIEPDEWLDGERSLVLGGTEIVLRPLGPAHTPEDLAVWLPKQRTVIAGDLVFRGRIPFVGQADSRHWIAALDQMLAWNPAVIVPGHGPAANAAARDDLLMTRDYLVHLRRHMGEAARQLEPFDEAYARTDWSRFEHLPLFKSANRINAYNVYLLMEQQAGK